MKNSDSLVLEIERYLERLFPICRSITGDGVRETLEVLRELLPIEVREVATGTPVYDWKVPEEWNIRKASISTATGENIVDFEDNALHVMGYSKPINEKMNWEDLSPHLHIHPKLENAIPYRTSYYERDWGFCVTWDQYERIKAAGTCDVLIDSNFIDGSLAYGECLIPGKLEQEILISCYICHPAQANDSLSGALLTAFLARKIMSLRERRYSYRIVFVPETIGAITYCALNENAMKKINLGLVITTVGGPGKLGYKKTWNSKHWLNRLIEDVFLELEKDYVVYPFDIHGSDERQYSSPGFRINVATVCKDKYYEYPEYHSSEDNLRFVNGDQIYETYKVYDRLIARLDARKILSRVEPHCELMLSKHDLYPKKGGGFIPTAGGHTELDLILWILFLSDGTRSLEDLAYELKVGEEEVRRIVERLLSKKLICVS